MHLTLQISCEDLPLSSTIADISIQIKSIREQGVQNQVGCTHNCSKLALLNSHARINKKLIFIQDMMLKVSRTQTEIILLLSEMDEWKAT